jgi:hypothetical protein
VQEACHGLAFRGLCRWNKGLRDLGSAWKFVAQSVERFMKRFEERFNRGEP